MIKLDSDEGRAIVRNYISALNGDSEDIKWANNKRKAEYNNYDNELKHCIDEVFNYIEMLVYSS